MDLQQARILLEKINSLFKSISADNGELSSIEKDLMMSYIRQFYETFINSDNSAPASKQATNRPASFEQEEVAPPKPIQRKKYTPPKIIEIPDSLKELEATTPKPEPTPQPKREPEPKASPRPQTSTTSAPPTGKIAALFSFKEAKELSEKLSQRPVTDLTKALTINDRLLYQNDLFGKSMPAMNESLELLNKFNSFDEAKSLLANLASQYDWVDEEKVDTARAFIQLVRRRYS